MGPLMERLFPVCCLFFCLLAPPLSYAGHDVADATYARLDNIRQQKKRQILHLFANLEKKSVAMKKDQIMHDFFFFRNELNQQRAFADKKIISSELNQVISDYSQSIDQYYLSNYLEFYDIMFINKAGDIIYTVRKEEDFQKNIFSSNLSTTLLAQQLNNNPDVFFVDYEYYSPADEPAAFFIVPMIRNGMHEGWILMQYAINKLNMLMVDYQELGNTGEIYLVNQKHLILTNSRFSAEDASLRLRVDTEAVDQAFQSGQGHKLINGYRGVNVFTSFEKFSLWGTQWALVASIEEDEIITNLFVQKNSTLSEPLFKRLETQTAKLSSGALPTGKLSKVDIDEFKKGAPGALLHTRGVSTCTAVAVLYPDRFAYLAHISPFDKIYGHTNLTNQLKDLIGRIKHYDIYLRELHNLRFVIVANHLDSFKNVIDKLTRYGIRLSQITFAYNPKARYANVTCSGDGSKTYIEWVADDNNSSSLVQDADTIENLNTAVMQVTGYSNK